MVEILIEDRYAEYETFVSSHKHGSFTQSVNWAKVKKGWDHAVIVSRDQDGIIKGGTLVLVRKIAPLHTALLYSPRGPVCDYNDAETLKDLLNGVKQLAARYHAYLYKIDPFLLETDEEGIRRLTDLGFTFTPGKGHGETIQTRHNYMICNLKGKTMEQVLSEVGRRVRYDMNYSARQGVECKICPIEKLPDFYKIYERTGRRDGFSIRPISYLQGILQAFPQNSRLYICYYEGEPLSGAITIQYAGKTAHVYGASSEEHREVRPNYLMQKTMIGWAVEGGCDIYDFQGVVIDPNESPSLYGVYEYKKQFKNGELVTFAGEFDYILRPMVNRLVNWAQQAVTALRRLKTSKHQ